VQTPRPRTRPATPRRKGQPWGAGTLKLMTQLLLDATGGVGDKFVPEALSAALVEPASEFSRTGSRSDSPQTLQRDAIPCRARGRRR